MAAHIKCMRMSALFVQKGEAEWHRGNTASVGNDWGVFCSNKKRRLRKGRYPIMMKKLTALLTALFLLLSATALADEVIHIGIIQFAEH